MAEPRVLVVAQAEDAALVTSALAAGQLAATPVVVGDVEAFRREVASGADAIVLGEGVEGLDLARTLATVRSTSRAPVVVVFARVWSEEGMRAALEGGAADYVDAARGAQLAPALARELLRGEARPPASTSPLHASHLLQAIVDALPFVVFLKDAEELRLRVVNETFAKMFGVTKEWLLGKLDHEYFPPEQAESFNLVDRRVLTTRQLEVFEEVARMDGADVTVRTRKLPIVDGEGRLYVMGIAEDITAQKDAEARLHASNAELESVNRKLEENIALLKKSKEISARTLASFQQRALQMETIRQQNESLDRLAQDLARAKHLEEQRSREIEQAARLKSEFLANFSHEIRTPLNGIIGYCDLLSREEGSRLTPHGRRDLQVVKTNAQALLGLINDILDLSKIEAGTVAVVRERIDLPALVDDCIATVRDYLLGKVVRLHAQIAPDVGAVESDGLKLRQILLNLVSNAAKFTDAGEIAIEARREGGELVLRVEDTGRGIPAEHLPFIFEKFRQVDGSSTRKVGGTGLGLAIVRELCRVLGGSVEVESILGRGSTFTVRLPNVVPVTGELAVGGAATGDTGRTAEGGATAVMARPSTSEKGTGATVLLVDDDPMVHQLFRTELEKEGIRVLLATDGIEALALARQARPTAIVLDLYLPKLDGWGVLAELKGDPALAAIPVVIVSIEEQRARGFSMGACEYLVKPVDPERLVTVVRRRVAPGGGEVVIVDDDPTARELAARQLRGAGFLVAEARDGTDALLRARLTKPALLVLDLMMPAPDGFEVLRLLRAEGLDLPVVVLTGKTLTAEEEQHLRDGMASVVQKGGSALEALIEEAKRVVMSQRRPVTSKLARVLYVEDSAQNRDVVRRHLHGVFEVLEAEDGEHGLDRAQRERPDLILMDLSLPRLDGWEATRRLKAGPLASIPVVALTAHASREDQARARAAGCDGYLTKPVDRDVLIVTIEKFLRGKATPPPAGPRDDGTVPVATARSA